MSPTNNRAHDRGPRPQDPPLRRTPVSLVTGFLGSGKTTLLRRMLEAPELARTAVIVNEFGDTDFNAVTLARRGPEVVPANAGCFCCNGRAQLTETLAELERRADAREVDRILIETSGLSDPVPVLQALINDPGLVQRYRVDTVISVIDAVVGIEHLDEHAEAGRQVALADRIVMSKTDVADDREVALLTSRLRELNTRAPIFEAVAGDVAVTDLLLFLGGVDQGRRDEAEFIDTPPHRHAGNASHDGIRSWTVRRSQPATETGLALWMDLMAAYRGNEVLRMKGIINVAGKPVLVESIRHVFHPPLTLEKWPDADHDTKVVVIAQGIERDTIERSFDALSFEPLREPLDSNGYARFLELMRDIGPAAAGRGGRR